MPVTLSGNVTVVSEVHLSKAFMPIESNEEPNVTDDKEGHVLKA